MEEKETHEESEKKPWYNTFWVWVWLVFFWPVGLYGLWNRVNPENRKWVVIGGVAFIFFGAVGSALEDSGPRRGNSSASGGASPYLTSNSLACYSERAFDKQMTLLAQGTKNLIRGCIVIRNNKDIAVDNLGILGESTVIDPSTGKTLWVNSESIEYR